MARTKQSAIPAKGARSAPIEPGPTPATAAAAALIGAKVDMTVSMIPLDELAVAPENVRRSRPAHVEDLAANIARYGLLQPLVGYAGTGRILVTIGARRLAALAKLGAPDAPVIVTDRADALARSLAENTQRASMHPADEAKAWAAMLADGGDVTAVANAFGHSERYVRQRIKLASLHPTIFAALAADKIDLAAAQAYTVAPADRQGALFKRLGDRAAAYSIRRELGEGVVASRERLAQFVGEAAYLAAGGAIERDLFAGGDDGYDSDGDLWLDRPLVEKLAAEKLEKTAERLRKEGWAFVEVADDFHLFHSGYERAPGKAAKTREEKAGRGCVVFRSWKDAIAIERDLVKKGSKAAKDAKAAAHADGEAPPPPDMTKGAHEAATRIASGVVGMALIEQPEAALTALCAHLARVKLLGERPTNPGWEWPHALALELPTPPSYGGGQAPNGAIFDPESAPELARTMAARTVAWSDDIARATENGAELEEALHAWPLEDKLALLAFCLAGAVQAIEHGPPELTTEKQPEWDPDGEDDEAELDEDAPEPEPELVESSAAVRRRRLAAIGRIAGAAPAAWWSPTPAWLKGLSRDALDRLADQLDVQPKPKQKGKLAEVCAAKAAELRWTPPLIAELTGTRAAPAPACKDSLHAALGGDVDGEAPPKRRRKAA